MRLTGADNTYLKFECGTNFEITGFGHISPERKTMISVGFTGGSGGGKLTQSSGLDISDALGSIKFDREIISVPDISSINGESEIEGDVFTYGERYSLILGRHEDSLSLRLRDIIKERSIYFLIESEVQGNMPSGRIVITTQRQFTQLMNLALSIQNYCKTK